MGSRFLLELADVLRAAGLPVVEVDRMSGGSIVEGDSWKTRARGSGGFDGNRPWGICWHHTASAPNTSAESNVAYATFNATDAPLCNLYLHRDGVWYVCAAGATNTEGKGGPLPVSLGTIPADQGNTHTIGIEAGNSGVGEPWPVVMIDSYFAGTIALIDAYQLTAGDVFTHAQWAPTRKIDPATVPAIEGPWRPRAIGSSQTWNDADVRAEVAVRAGLEPEPEPEGDDMKWSKLQIVEAGAVFMGLSDGLVFPQAEWVNGNDPRQLARFEGYERAGWGYVMTLSYRDCTGVCLLGPVPTGDDKFAQNGLHWSREMFGNVIP